MLKVATGFNAPIKLLMPQLLNFWFDRPRNRCSLLGLGDIVIPGLFIGFCIRFGRYLAKTKNIDSEKTSYVCPMLTAYSVALITCGLCLVVFESAQPALLYISPALIVTAFFVALERGHVKDMIRGIDVQIELKEDRESFKYARSSTHVREQQLRRIEVELTENADESPLESALHPTRQDGEEKSKLVRRNGYSGLS